MRYKKTTLAALLLSLVLFGIIQMMIASENATATNDKIFIENLLKEQVRLGMDISELEAVFEEYNQALGLWECAEEAETIAECKAEKALVVSLPLPNRNVWLGNGDAQVYLYMDKDSQLEGYEFELYYPRHH